MSSFVPRYSKEQLVQRFSPDDMPEEIIRRIADLLDPDPATFSSKTRIILQGEPGDAMFFISEGHAEVTVTPFGVGSPFPPLSIAELGPGDVVGEMAVLSGEPRSATVTAIDDVVAYRLSRDNWIHIEAFYPGVAAAIREVAAGRARALAGWDQTQE